MEWGKSRLTMLLNEARKLSFGTMSSKRREKKHRKANWTLCPDCFSSLGILSKRKKYVIGYKTKDGKMRHWNEEDFSALTFHSETHKVPKWNWDVLSVKLWLNFVSASWLHARPLMLKLQYFEIGFLPGGWILLLKRIPCVFGSKSMWKMCLGMYGPPSASVFTSNLLH